MNWQILTNLGLVLGILSSLITIGEKVRARPVPPAATGLPGAATGAPAAVQRPDVWRVDQRHILFMVVGALLYAVISTIVADHYMSARIGVVYFTSLTSALTVLCGVVGGPWVGLFVGAVGYTLTGVPHLTNTAGSFPFPPAYAVGDGLAGLIAGLTLIVTGGRFASWGSLIVVEIMSAIGIVVGDFCSFAIHQAQAGHDPNERLAVGMRSDLVCALVLLPLVLLLIGRRTPSPARP